MKPMIIALVGPSGSGKTTLALHLERAVGIPQLVSHVTRPMRDGEVQGREHWFVDESQMPPRDAMLAYGFFGGHHYWVALNDLSGVRVCTYAIDEVPLLEMIDKFGDRFHIVPVRVERDYDVAVVGAERIARDKGRPVLPREFYKAWIDNDGTLGEFLEKGVAEIKKLVTDCTCGYCLYQFGCRKAARLFRSGGASSNSLKKLAEECHDFMFARYFWLK